MAKSKHSTDLSLQFITHMSSSLKREHWVITNEYMDAVKVRALLTALFNCSILLPKSTGQVGFEASCPRGVIYFCIFVFAVSEGRAMFLIYFHNTDRLDRSVYS
jgi:hypothetical protein